MITAAAVDVMVYNTVSIIALRAEQHKKYIPNNCKISCGVWIGNMVNDW
jgi:hypothetical protein